LFAAIESLSYFGDVIVGDGIFCSRIEAQGRCRRKGESVGGPIGENGTLLVRAEVD
jgi:hypothetical protein